MLLLSNYVIEVLMLLSLLEDKQLFKFHGVIMLGKYAL